jgi:hypothetical protein
MLGGCIHVPSASNGNTLDMLASMWGLGQHYLRIVPLGKLMPGGASMANKFPDR